MIYVVTITATHDFDRVADQCAFRIEPAAKVWGYHRAEQLRQDDDFEWAGYTYRVTEMPLR